uniref:Uncharacterized protein n=1 Tax=viral metagenome TaxID=1070528 RepID=A0A6M3KHF4_9ZZZZ
MEMMDVIEKFRSNLMSNLLLFNDILNDFHCFFRHRMLEHTNNIIKYDITSNTLMTFVDNIAQNKCLKNTKTPIYNPYFFYIQIYIEVIEV